MTVQRFRPDVERTRRGFGWVFMAVAVVLIALLAWLEILASRVTTTAFVMFALFAALFALGYRLAFRVRDLFEIDVQAGTYSLMQGGARAGSGPLDRLGPLEVRHRVRRSGKNTVSEYVVFAAAHSAVDLYVESTAGKARRKMEALARAWRVPCRSLGGAARDPDKLDVPLHDRLRDDRGARAAADLRPEWGLRIEPLPVGYAIRSTYRSWTPLAPSVVILVVTPMILGQPVSRDILSSFRDPDDLMGHVFSGLFGIIGLSLLWVVFKGLRDTFFPGTVSVTDRGVSYRGSRMAFREIEEVTSRVPVEVVGDRRSLTLGDTFCPPAATDAVAHELQRLIIEVAEANPHARRAS